ncbi:MAG: tRNA dihydrouridine synthase DusB [Eubacteriales bacterium]
MFIGKIEIKHGLILAPMAGVTDHAFRIMCKRQGASFMVSEMISAKGMHYNDKKTAALAVITEEEQPMALQIFGCEPDFMTEAAVSLTERFSPAMIDINMGCPVHKVVSNGEGCALMRNLPAAASVIRSVVRSVKIPVTVKIRSGWDSESINAVEAAKTAEQEGAAAVCIHGRTREQMYRPPVDLSVIRDVKNAVSIPVIGNGGIKSAADALEMFDQTGCDAVMIARGACGNPWIFAQIIAAIERNPYYVPSKQDHIDAAIIHAEMLIQDKGNIIGVFEARKHIAWYIKNIPDSAKIRQMINSAVSLDEIKNILYNI